MVIVPYLYRNNAITRSANDDFMIKVHVYRNKFMRYKPYWYIYSRLSCRNDFAVRILHIDLVWCMLVSHATCSVHARMHAIIYMHSTSVHACTCTCTLYIIELESAIMEFIVLRSIFFWALLRTYTFIWCVRAQHMQISKVGNRFPDLVELIIGVMSARQS